MKHGEQKSLTSFNKQSIYVRNVCVKKKKLWGNNFCQDISLNTLPYQTFFSRYIWRQFTWERRESAEINICFMRKKMRTFSSSHNDIFMKIILVVLQSWTLHTWVQNSDGEKMYLNGNKKPNFFFFSANFTFHLI